jgi:NADPH-dependent ferric siderophore reductase
MLDTGWNAIRTFVVEVVGVEDVHPHLRRITFGGADLASFEPLGPDTFLYVLLPPLGRTELTVDRSFTWEAYGQMPEAERPVGAYYTLRRWDAEAKRIEALFVLHGDEGAASAWAMRARVGDPVALWGPRTAFGPPAGTDRYLLVADETGLPAVAAIVESLDDDVPVHVVAEVAGVEGRQELPERPSVAVTWLHRDGAEPGTTTLLVDAVRALPAPTPTTYVWGGGESRAMTAVRKLVRRDRGLAREQASLVGYWRHAAHAGDPDEPDDD